MPDVFVAEQKIEEPAKETKEVLSQKPVVDSEINDNITMDNDPITH